MPPNYTVVELSQSLYRLVGINALSPKLNRAKSTNFGQNKRPNDWELITGPTALESMLFPRICSQINKVADNKRNSQSSETIYTAVVVIDPILIF